MKVNVEDWKKVLTRIVDTNKKLHNDGLKAISVNITGKHGLGKSSSVEQVANESGLDYIHVDVSQMEVEDLIGYPVTYFEISNNSGQTKWVDEKSLDGWIKKGATTTGKSQMKYATPEFLNLHNDTPKLLCLDDYSRGSSAMMQAIMQITHSQSYMSWKLPQGSTVVLTSNPSDDSDYSVVEIDKAQQDRFANFELKYDAEVWARYAEGRVDDRCINFMLFYPELVTQTVEGKAKILNSPRSFENFFNSIRYVDSFQDDIGFIQKMGESTLTDEASTHFIMFINNNLDKLPKPDVIFNSEEYIQEYNKAINDESGYRNDIACVLSLRMINFLVNFANESTVKPDHLERIEKIILSKVFGEDNNYNILRSLLAGSKKYSLLISKPSISEYLQKN